MKTAIDTTQLLIAAQNGNAFAQDTLIRHIYAELRRIAHQKRKAERAGHTLSTTDLMHEAYIRLHEIKEVTWQNKGHFYALFSTSVRRVLVDYARKRLAQKRGGAHAEHISLNEDALLIEDHASELVRVHEALDVLKSFDKHLAQVVEYKFFGGMDRKMIAESMGTSVRTVARQWNKAKTLLERIFQNED